MIVRWSTRAALWSVALVAVACGGSTADWQGTIEVRAGVTWVANPAEGLWQARENPPLGFELEQAFGADREPEEAILGRGGGLAAAAGADSNLYVMDAQSSRLLAFAPDGSVRWVVGGPGQGPGEFEDASQIALSEAGTIAVTNKRRSRVDLWNTSGEYLRGHAMNEPPLDQARLTRAHLAGFLGPDVLVFFSGIRGAFGSRVVLLRLTSMSIQSRFAWNQLPDLEMPVNLSSETPVRASHGAILVGSSVGYSFRAYDATGSLALEVSRAVDYPIRSGFYEEDGRRGMAGFGVVQPPMPLDSGHILVHVSWSEGVEDPDATAREIIASMRERREPPAFDQHATFDLFDEEGRFLYSLPADDGMGDPQFVGPDGRLYTISDEPFPQIRRYRVVIDE